MRSCFGWVVVVSCVLCAACEQESNVPAPPEAGTGGGAGTGGSAGEGGTAGNAGEGGTAGGGATGGDGDARPGGSHPVTIRAWTEASLLRAEMTVRDIQPLDEGHLCAEVRLSNDEPVWITDLRATIGDGSHHMIVSRTNSPPSTTANECFALLGGEDNRLVIAQQHNTRFTLPDGAGFLLQPHETITMQIHFINITSAELNVTGGIELTTRPADTALEPASIVFTGPLGLSVPARQSAVTEHFAMQGSASKPLRVFALTSHTHQLGTRATITRQSGASATGGTLLHESRNWSEPPLDRFDPPLVFDGSDGLLLRCEYTNTTDRDVGFGTSFNNEMCFMWLYAY